MAAKQLEVELLDAEHRNDPRDADDGDRGGEVNGAGAHEHRAKDGERGEGLAPSLAYGIDEALAVGSHGLGDRMPDQAQRCKRSKACLAVLPVA